ncbi:hypothetical protein AXF42_Ash009930 [Apostasia shenzhenica]|uniref:Uncharacterized protein n=1 Tax=Apostasia shenzhenica TaxID=1088818 RepID=A0A2I0ACD4_9ASPA|nr:hypothetical protein AXF42_Ash009930 [Apostasia shenzhenica]
MDDKKTCSVMLPDHSSSGAICAEMSDRVPRPIRMMASAAAYLLGGLFTISLASSAAIKMLKSVSESNKRKLAIPCSICKGKGFYNCKLCKGKSTIEWSPLYDPIAINPCLCPTCDGNRIQRCLNCLGKGYV